MFRHILSSFGKVCSTVDAVFPRWENFHAAVRAKHYFEFSPRFLFLRFTYAENVMVLFFELRFNNMCVNSNGFKACNTEQFLDFNYVEASAQSEGCECMSQTVGGNLLFDSRPLSCFSYNSLHLSLIHI